MIVAGVAQRTTAENALIDALTNGLYHSSQRLFIGNLGSNGTEPLHVKNAFVFQGSPALFRGVFRVQVFVFS